MHKWIRKGFSILPRRLKHLCYRNFLNLSLNPSANLIVRLATTKEELEAAFRLLHDSYVGAGFMDPDPSGMRVTVYHALPTTSTIIVCMDKEVVGTLSLIRDNPLGMPINAICDTKGLLGKNFRVAEVSALAIKKEYRDRRGEILFPLLKYMHEYCITYFGVEILVIAVNPNHVDFYDALLCFTVLDSKTVKEYSFVKGAPAVTRFLDLKTAKSEYAYYYGHRPDSKNLFEYFFLVKLPQLVFPDRSFFKISDSIMTPELFDYFFNIKTNVATQFSSPQKHLLAKLYDTSKYASVLPESLPKAIRGKKNSHRYEVNCKGRILLQGGKKKIFFHLRNVSHRGLCVILDEPLLVKESVEADVEIADFDIAHLRIHMLWNDISDGRHGFGIQRASKNWDSYLDYLNEDLLKKVA